MRFLLRSDFPNVFITDEDGRDRYWVRSGVGDRVGLWSLRDLTGKELVCVAQHGPGLVPAYGVYRAGQRVATVCEAPGERPGRWLRGVRALVKGAPGKLRYTVRAPGTQPLEVDGDPTEVEYRFTRAGRQAATVGLQWLACTTALGTSVNVADGEDPVLILAVTTMIESAWGRL